MFEKGKAVFVTAAGTPLDDKGNLVEESFRKHLRHQVSHGIDGFLIAGSMGQMACLTDETYARTVEAAADEVAGEARIMVGCGDTSFERTLARIEAVSRFKIDALVAKAPYYFTSSQKDLLYYFRKVADASPLPLYIYDLPQATKVKTELATMLALSEHPNIAGAKCSHDPAYVRRLYDLTRDRDFEVFSAQYDLIDMFLRYGITLQLDGFFGIMPQWLARIKEAYDQSDFEAISQVQKQMTELRTAFFEIGVFPGFTVAMNLLGFEGRFHPSHIVDLEEPAISRVRELMEQADLLG